MTTSLKLTLALILVAIAIIAGALVLTNNSDPDTTATDDPTTSAPTEVPAPGDPSESTPTSPETTDAPAAADGVGAPLVRPDSPRLSEGGELTVVEFLDFECPSCAMFHPVVKDVLAEYGDRVTFVVRYVPLHQNSKSAFQAAEAAGAQGKYVEMYDRLFDAQADWAGQSDVDAIFAGYAEELGLDSDQFAADFASPEIAARIAESEVDALDVNVAGTPTFFVGGEMVEFQSYDDLGTAISDALD